MKEHFGKNIISALVMGTLLLANSVAYAAPVDDGPGISYQPGTKTIEVDGNATDLFTNMKDLSPGATAKQVIQLSNNGAEDVVFYLQAWPTEGAKFDSEEAKVLSDELLDLMELEVSVTLKGQEPKVIYSGLASGKIEESAGDTLTKGVLLGKVAAGQTAAITATLIVPGDKVDNRFQSAEAKIDWRFQCELADPTGGGGEPPGGGGSGGTDGGGGTDDGGTTAPPVDPTVDIDELGVPLAAPPAATVEEEVIDITDGEVPLGAFPDVIIVADDVPLANLPKTGGLTNYLDEIGILLIVLCAGLVVVRKMEKKKAH